MPTPVYLTNWSHRVAPTQNGGGIYSVVSGSVMSIDTTTRPPQALKCITSASSGYVGYAQISGANVVVGRVYVYFPTALPSSSMQFITGNGTGIFANVRYNSATGNFEVGNSDLWTAGSAAAANTEYRIDFRINISGTTYTMDWQINGVEQTQWALGSQTPSTWSNLRLGSQNSSTGTVLFQHLILSVTSADYPIGPGGTECLLPESDGTHNAGTNVIEDNTGADIGVTPAYNKVNTLPPGTTPYIRQAVNGTGNYAEIQFANMVASPGSILGAVATLGYTSETTTANRGACIVSKDDFASFTTVWGNPTVTADYSDGATNNVFWKSAVISGAVDLTTVNALEARLGYSDDANPDPYWMALCVEVAYTESTNDINLDLVTYSNSFPDLTILENEIVPLDLVSYPSTINDVVILENIPEPLDLVTYTSAINDITVTENIVESLDLVSYSSSVSDLTVLEHEIILLDLVTYSSSVPDLTVLENEIVPLDLVSYSSSIPDITLLENIDIPLDLVSYSSEAFDLSVLENEIIPLDLVSYSSEVFDLDVLENVVESLDLVTFFSEFFDLDVLEAGDIQLDLVEYSSVFEDLSVLEHDIVSLELVSYTSVVNDLSLEAEAGDILLDLVVYSSSFPELTLVQEVLPKTPIERTFAIRERNSLTVIDSQKRIVSVDYQDRTIY